MLHFFRRIRRDLLANGKTIRYLKYGIGEIILVVIGILIALQVNNWNEERINRERYEFGIKQLHAKIKARSLWWDAYLDRAEYHLIVIDSLLNMPDSIPPNRILSNLLVLDEIYASDWTDEEWFLDYLDFNPTDPIQFEVAQNLRRYFYGGHRLFMDYVLEKEPFSELLLRQYIPICERDLAQSYKEFIEWCSQMSYSNHHQKELRRFISSEHIVSKLTYLKVKRERMVETRGNVERPESAPLKVLEKHFDFLPTKFEYIEMVGSGTMAKNWSTGFKMTPLNPEHTIWECKTSLNNGWIKFRTDDNWTFAWGIGELNPEKLIFGGPNIPVVAGKFHVIIDIENNTLQLKSI